MTRHYPDLGSDKSSVWNFCACFSDETSANKRNRFKSTNQKPCPFEQLVQENTCFVGGLLRWLTEQKHPKFLRIIRNDLWWAAVAFSSLCSKFLYCWLWDRPTQTFVKTFFSLIYTNVMIPYVYVIVYSSRKMVCNGFWTGSEYKTMHSLIVLDVDL